LELMFQYLMLSLIKYFWKMETTEKDKLVFSITVEDLQSEALEKIGRTLTDEEIQAAKKGLEFGLYTDIDTVYATIFFEMIEK
jgi:hypothetical protein